MSCRFYCVHLFTTEQKRLHWSIVCRVSCLLFDCVSACYSTCAPPPRSRPTWWGAGRPAAAMRSDRESVATTPAGVHCGGPCLWTVSTLADIGFVFGNGCTIIIIILYASCVSFFPSMYAFRFSIYFFRLSLFLSRMCAHDGHESIPALRTACSATAEP